MNTAKLVFIVSTALLAAGRLDAIEIEIQKAPRLLRIILVNDSLEEIKVNKRLAYGPPGGWAEIDLEITDAKGQHWDYNTKQKIGPAGERDWCFLSPRQFVGIEILIEELKSSYGLPPGRYSVVAHYSSKGSSIGFTGELRSKPMDLFVSQ